MTQKAPEAFRTISEVASDLDLPQHVLRFWETRFSQIKPMKRGGGRRYYRPEDVDLLRGIRHLLYGEGYTIKGVKRILKERGVRHVMDAWKEEHRGAPPPVPAASGSQPVAPVMSPEPQPSPQPAASAPPPVTAPSVGPGVAEGMPTNGSAAQQPDIAGNASADSRHTTPVPAPVHAPVVSAEPGGQGVAPPVVHHQTTSAVVPAAPSVDDGQLPQIGALRQVSTGTGAASVPLAPHPEQAAISGAPVPGPAVPQGPISQQPNPPPTAAATPALPETPTPASSMTPAPVAVAPAAFGSEGRQKLQSALYELTECRRILFDALRAGEE